MSAKVTTYKDAKGVGRALAHIAPQAQRHLDAEAAKIASDMATMAQGRARSAGGIAGRVAPFIHARGASIVMDGSGQLRDGPRQTIGDVMFGAEFGSGHFRQFSPWNSRGYFLYGTLAASTADNMDRYSEALDDALDAI